MRLFVAVDLDDDARGAIAAERKRLVDALGGGSSSLRWVRIEEMHLTLEFLGEIDEARAAAVTEAMREDVNAAPFTMVCAGLGVFPPQGAPRVLWLGVASGYRELIALQRQIADRLASTGRAREPRPFHPHLTLARWRDACQADRGRVLAADRGAEVARVDVRAVTLYQSQLSAPGPRHTVLARAILRA
jgi:2'-5' RNA ligase